MLERILAHPLTRGLDLDSPQTTELRREIVKSKAFLRLVYMDWYERIAERVPEGDGRVLELGSGPGFLAEVLPGVITSEVVPVRGVTCVADARRLPIRDQGLKAIAMTNVFHHIPDVTSFLSEAQRALRPGGRIIMIEPWNTGWSRFVHERFHSEPMLPEVEDWAFPDEGPLSAANAALAWVVTKRDLNKLEGDFPSLRVRETQPFMPFRYLASGGVSLRSIQPGWMYPFWHGIDRLRIFRRMSVFATITIERV